MILGNGMIANIFKSSQYSFDNVIIFASGVSDSQSSDIEEFEREISMLTPYINSNKKIIYFSSIHILDASTNQSAYAKHKQRVEDYIQNNFMNYIIYRLPIVVGSGGNRKSLFNYLHNSIVSNEKMFIFKDAYRFLIDIYDIPFLVYKTNMMYHNKTINMTLEQPYLMLDIVKTFGKILNIKPIYTLVDKGSMFNVDNREVKEIINNYAYLQGDNKENYLVNLIKKYYIKE